MALFPPDAEGTLIGERYRIVREIGRGGMGVVYEALDEVLERRVALKFLDTNSSDEQFRERFGHEAAVLARLASRHIVAIYDYEAHEGTPYLVTQLVPDGDLHSRLNLRGAMPPGEAVDMALQICEALADAHAEGILHRDVKPANVLLHRQRSGTDRAYLCDFGIAVSEETEFTQTGAIVGTTSYLAPERLNGAPASVATDIYSLGCLVWAMLTGRAPYAGTEFQVMEAHVKAPPPQLVVGPPFCEGINEFFQLAMAKDPALRLSSVAEAVELLADLVPSATGVSTHDLVPRDPEPRGTAHEDQATRYVAPGSSALAASPLGPKPPNPDVTQLVDQSLAASSAGPSRPGPPAPRSDRTTVRAGTTGAPPTGGAPRLPTGSGAHGPVRPGRQPAATPITKVLALVALLVVVGAAIVAVVTSGGGDTAPITSATDTAGSTSPSEPASPSSDVASTPDPSTATLPQVPELTATSAYRSVMFRAATVPGDLVLQRLDDRGQWQTTEAASRKYTPMGGERVCARFRFATPDGVSPPAAGEPVRVCGRASAPSIELVRTKQRCTSENQARGCRYYDIRAAGFTPGSSPLVYLYTSGTTLFCPACVPREMTMDQNGRGVHDGPRPNSLGEVQITPSATYPAVTIEIDGVRRTFRLL